ncbi:methionyl-tRNA formyltransferase [Corticibacter populi]|uniref:Methionyl-tRNA formyltransferase n=1 Tax=Corticibacter populi TaxID=1550736 RepID=A0A3M6QZ69_9BURK|nr:methionyl-tRNA formyltransferase [Corticibacter populi]RMX08324.1 methionyl-tRNA formyltransferase [Corticibacter populi]RZS35611.1 methionyl-tRNA formyltransferase [Corticibacter populi]
MRTAFAGTPEFANVALQAMITAGFTPAAILTQPDRPAGRGMQLQASPVKQTALAHGVPVLQPAGLRLNGRHAEAARDTQAGLAALELDVLVVAAYGLILPEWVLQLPRLGCLNIHASLLPRWRGAAPIHRAIEAGDTQTGITIMQMDAGLDTGDMLLTTNLAIGADETTGELHDRLAALGGQSIVQVLQQMQASGAALPATPQPQEGVNYAHKISKTESWLDWALPARLLAQRVRAFNPFPAAQARLNDDAIKIWRAHAEATSLPAGALPGTVLAAGADGITVACGEGVLCLTELQRAGGKRLPVAQFLNGFVIHAGDRFNAAPAQ